MILVCRQATYSRFSGHSNGVYLYGFLVLVLSLVRRHSTYAAVAAAFHSRDQHLLLIVNHEPRNDWVAVPGKPVGAEHRQSLFGWNQFVDFSEIS